MKSILKKIFPWIFEDWNKVNEGKVKQLNNLFYMETSDFFCNKREELILSGNFFTHHFLDIENGDWNKIKDNIEFFKEGHPFTDDFLKLLQIDRIVKIHGVYYFIRFKDRLRKKLSDEVTVQNKVDAEIKQLYENPPLWASVFRDEYKKITAHARAEDGLNSDTKACY